MEAPGGAPGVLARSVPVYVKIPTESEFLVYKSTPQGYVSYRNSEIGTRFIQTLCEVLDLEAKSSSPRDMLTLLTLVNRQGHFLSITITISINKTKKNCGENQFPPFSFPERIFARQGWWPSLISGPVTGLRWSRCLSYRALSPGWSISPLESSERAWMLTLMEQ